MSDTKTRKLGAPDGLTVLTDPLEVYELYNSCKDKTPKERADVMADAGWMLRTAWANARLELEGKHRLTDAQSDAVEVVVAMMVMVVIKTCFGTMIDATFANEAEDEVVEFDFSDEECDRIIKLLHESGEWRQNLEARGLL